MEDDDHLCFIKVMLTPLAVGDLEGWIQVVLD